MPPKPRQNCEPSCDLFVTNSSWHPNCVAEGHGVNPGVAPCKLLLTAGSLGAPQTLNQHAQPDHRTDPAHSQPPECELTAPHLLIRLCQPLEQRLPVCDLQLAAGLLVPEELVLATLLRRQVQHNVVLPCRRHTTKDGQSATVATNDRLPDAAPVSGGARCFSHLQLNDLLACVAE